MLQVALEARDDALAEVVTAPNWVVVTLIIMRQIHSVKLVNQELTGLSWLW